MDQLYAEHLQTRDAADRSVARGHRFRCIGRPGRQPAHPVPGRSGLPVQGESALQSVGADCRQSAMSPGLRAGRAAAGVVPSAERLLASARATAARTVDRFGGSDADGRSGEGRGRLDRISDESPSSARSVNLDPPDMALRQRRGAARATALRPGRQDAVRARMPATCKRAGRPGSPGSARGVSPRRIRIRSPHELSRRVRAARRGDALQQYRRLQRACGRAALPAPRSAGAPRAALFLDRRRRAIPRIRRGHHAHPCSASRPLRRARGAPRTAPAAALRRDRLGARLPGGAFVGAPHAGRRAPRGRA